MSEELPLRLTDPTSAPTPAQVESWVGKRAWGFWTSVVDWIARNYPGVFEPEWLFGGKQHGWALRYKKSKPLCTFVPEKGRFQLLIVFGAEEREKVDAIQFELSKRTWQNYDLATVYHDGKWLLLPVDRKEVVADIERLLSLKRKPRPINPIA
jgi:hypothetical protein